MNKLWILITPNDKDHWYIVNLMCGGNFITQRVVKYDDSHELSNVIDNLMTWKES